MPITYYKTPVGTCQITEEDGFITRVHILDDEHDATPAETPLMQQVLKEFDEYFAGTRQTFSFPIKQYGSDFQQLVWQELLKIDYGKTITYGQQSVLMKNPLAIRAIAAANGKNNLWVVVPCHRVIGSNGSLTGYAGGIWRKKWLLDHEAKVIGKGQTKLEF
ncbi:MAG: methylated-DNA--[protein]-cysteine S-methyltransferase [Bacteroidota bacterium]